MLNSLKIGFFVFVLFSFRFCFLFEFRHRNSKHAQPLTHSAAATRKWSNCTAESLFHSSTIFPFATFPLLALDPSRRNSFLSTPNTNRVKHSHTHTGQCGRNYDFRAHVCGLPIHCGEMRTARKIGMCRNARTHKMSSVAPMPMAEQVAGPASAHRILHRVRMVFLAKK